MIRILPTGCDKQGNGQILYTNRDTEIEIYKNKEWVIDRYSYLRIGKPAEWMRQSGKLEDTQNRDMYRDSNI